jgi:hypothetical protein
VLCSFLCLLLLPQAGLGQRYRRGGPAWQYLGNAHVDGAVDHDNIKVGRAEGPFHEIQFRVRGGAIEFQRVVVHYGNGEPDQIPVRNLIRAGGQTRPIDLRGARRDIRSVELWYAKARWAQRPTVELYGR